MNKNTVVDYCMYACSAGGAAGAAAIFLVLSKDMYHIGVAIGSLVVSLPVFFFCAWRVR